MIGPIRRRMGPCAARRARSLISVVVPTLQEAGTIDGVLAALEQNEGPLEVIVSDGGSEDSTVERARRHRGVRVISAPRGRAAQINHGAAHATGEILWMLHADCRPPADAARVIRRTLAVPNTALGAFRFRIDARGILYRIIELGVRLRSEWLKTPYGDQGLFLRRADFDQVGGLPVVPILEDLMLVRRFRRRIAVVDVPLPTSSRRWQRFGAVRVTLRNWAVVVLYRAGLSPRKLARIRGP